MRVSVEINYFSNFYLTIKKSLFKYTYKSWFLHANGSNDFNSDKSRFKGSTSFSHEVRNFFKHLRIDVSSRERDSTSDDFFFSFPFQTSISQSNPIQLFRNGLFNRAAFLSLSLSLSLPLRLFQPIKGLQFKGLKLDCWLIKVTNIYILFNTAHVFTMLLQSEHCRTASSHLSATPLSFLTCSKNTFWYYKWYSASCL